MVKPSREDFIKSTCTRGLWVIAIAFAQLFLLSCTDNRRPIPRTEYSAKIVGRWQGTAGDLKEDISFEGNGTFVCRIQQNGFIANTLSQSTPGTVRGTWKLVGVNLTFRITGAKNELVENRMTESTILALKENEVVLRSDRGETSSFYRRRF